MAYKSEMARARGDKRAAVAAERRALKHKMNQYNPLANKSRAIAADFKVSQRETPQTTNDILLQLADTMANKRDSYKRKSFIDQFVPDQISEVTRQYWRDRIGRGGIKF